MRRVDLLCTTHEVLDIPHQGALSCCSHGCGGACPFKPLQPVLQGAMLTISAAGKAHCFSVGRE